MYKYFAAGKEISKNEHENIISGKTDKFIQCSASQPGISLAMFSDHINVVNGVLDKNDPLLNEVLNAVNLPLDKTYIILVFRQDQDHPISAVKGMLYGYW